MYNIIYTKQAAGDLAKVKAANLTATFKDLLQHLRTTPVSTKTAEICLPKPFEEFYVLNLSVLGRVVYRVVTQEKKDKPGTVMIVRIIANTK